MTSPTQAQAEAIALEALKFLGSDRERIDRFFVQSGLDAASLRAAAAGPGFLCGVLDHLLGEDRLLIAFAAESGVASDLVHRARATLCGPETFD